MVYHVAPQKIVVKRPCLYWDLCPYVVVAVVVVSVVVVVVIEFPQTPGDDSKKC